MKNILLILSICSVLLGCSNNKEELNVYTWSDYFSPELIEQFENENNCRIIISTFDSNEAMYAKLKAGGTGYDIMLPTSYQIEILAKEGMIDKIDHSKLINVISNFNHSLENQILDKNMVWSIPYACTYGGLMCDAKLAKEATSWNILANKNYRGKISLLDDIRETIGIGLMYKGYSLNSTNEVEINEATEQILSWKDNIRKFDAESYKLEVANKSTLIGHGYSSDAAQIILEENRDDIAFVLPDEGFSIAWDEFVIASDSQHKDLAYKFIDFFYDKDIAMKNMMYICSPMANLPGFEALPGSYKKILMPKNLDKGQIMTGFSDSRTLEIYNRAWDKIKSIR